MEEVAEGFVLDVLADAEGAAEQVGGIGFAVVAALRCGYTLAVEAAPSPFAACTSLELGRGTSG